MDKLLSPLVAWRNRNDVTQQALASQIGISRPQLSRLEAGTYEHLPANVIELTGIDEATYQRYRLMKRRAFNLALAAPVSQFMDGKAFRLWRNQIAWERFMTPTLNAFAYALCLNVNYLVKYEDSGTQMPPSLVEALSDCNASWTKEEIWQLNSH